MTTGRVEDLLRELAPQVLGALVRRHGHLDLCEDATQDALLQASLDWTKLGVPEHPRGWLLTVATRRFIDRVRSESARRQREGRVIVGAVPAELAHLAGEDDTSHQDDSLILLYMCCHPALSPPSQIALTLRAVGGLSTNEIAAAFFVPETTMAQRISRAKESIRRAGAVFAMPAPDDLEDRTRTVLHILYLVFNEGYTTSSGSQVNRVELTSEAIRLTRELHRLRPEDAETSGLLALMLLTEARRPARTTSSGDLIPLAEQDRSLWNKALVDEGVQLVTLALAKGRVGAYQLQAAIAAVHDEATSTEDTDWAQVLALYESLDRVSPNPMATINRCVAVGMVHGPLAGLDLLATVEGDRRVADHHLVYAVRGHLLDIAGRPEAAARAFEVAARRTASLPEKRFLRQRASECAGKSREGG